MAFWADVSPAVVFVLLLRQTSHTLTCRPHHLHTCRSSSSSRAVRLLRCTFHRLPLACILTQTPHMPHLPTYAARLAAHPLIHGQMHSPLVTHAVALEPQHTTHTLLIAAHTSSRHSRSAIFKIDYYHTSIIFF